MVIDRFKTWHRIMLLGAAVTAAALTMVTFAVHDAKRRILQALGSRATVGAISLSYPVVTLRDVRIAADPSAGAWPAPEEFHAALVQVRIDMGSLWAYRRGAPLRVSDVRVEDGLLVILRTTGHLSTLPALRDGARANAATQAAASLAAAAPPPAASAAADADATTLVVQRTRVSGMTVDFYDATLPGGGVHRARFAQVGGEIDGVALPALAQPIAVDLHGTLEDGRGGTVSIRGALTPARHDADLALRLADVDLPALQPWLARFGERPVRRGRLDLTLDAHVVDRRLEAPGRIVLRGLEFGPDDGTHGPFAGIGRRAVLAALQRDGRIDLAFTLAGRTDDPAFSLDEKLGLRVVAALGETVGLSAKGVVQGVGDVIQGLAKGGQAAR